jgi:hypothetical protein
MPQKYGKILMFIACSYSTPLCMACNNVSVIVPLLHSVMLDDKWRLACHTEIHLYAGIVP